MKYKKYQTPAALLSSLSERIKQKAKSDGLDIQRLQRLSSLLKEPFEKKVLSPPTFLGKTIHPDELSVLNKYLSEFFHIIDPLNGQVIGLHGEEMSVLGPHFLDQKDGEFFQIPKTFKTGCSL